MDFLLTIFFVLLIIAVLVFVHELGHFLTAKLSGITVEEFAIGFGKSIFSKTYKGTKYSLNILPIGGFVQLEGENIDEGPNSFRNKKFRYKALVLLAGVVMNLLLAIILLAIYLNINNYKFLLPNLTSYTFTNTSFQGSYYPLTVRSVVPKGPSDGQISVGEIIVGINEIKFKDYKEFVQILKNNQNKTIQLLFIDKDSFKTYSRDIKIGSIDSNGAILEVGFNDITSIKNTYFIKYNSSFTSGISMTYDLFIYQIKALGSLVKQSVQTGNYDELSNNVGSLPKVTDQVSQVVQFQQFDLLIPLTALFSINLAMINILPFPALDGGQLLIAFIEKVRGKRLPDNLVNNINTIGFVFLMGLGLILIFKDIIQLKWIEGLGNILQKALGK